MTKLFHPNVSAAGEICVNTLKKDWKPTHGLEHILLVVRCLLIDPNPASALNEEAGKLLLEEYDAFFKRAQLMTVLAHPTSHTTLRRFKWIHATFVLRLRKSTPNRPLLLPPLPL